MRKSKMALGLITALSLLVASSVFAAGPYGAGPGLGGAMGMGGGAGLAKIDNLTKDQQDKINAEKTDFLKKTEVLRSQKALKRIDLMDFAAKNPQDESTIQKKKEEIWALQDQIRNDRRAFGTKIRSLLTPEQREKLGVTGLGRGFCGHGGPGGMGGFRQGKGGGMGFGPRS
ncbi:MAG: periplasmic heavy metal sensor [Pseudomonadota bacterium]